MEYNKRVIRSALYDKRRNEINVSPEFVVTTWSAKLVGAEQNNAVRTVKTPLADRWKQSAGTTVRVSFCLSLFFPLGTHVPWRACLRCSVSLTPTCFKEHMIGH